MSFLLESPLPAVIVGGMLTAILIGGWIQTALTWLLPSAAGVLLVTGSLVWLENAVVTEREEVEQTLQEIVEVVAEEALDGLLAHLHPDAEHARSKVRAEFPKYEFGEISIRPNLEVTIIEGTPLAARATFNVVADGGIRSLGMEDVTVRRYVEVKFRQLNGRWLVHDYEHFEPLHGMRDTHSDRY